MFLCLIVWPKSFAASLSNDHHASEFVYRYVLSEDQAAVSYDWFEVGVLDYDSHYKEYLVQKVNSAGRVVDENGHPVVNGGLGPDGQCLVIFFLIFCESEFMCLHLSLLCVYVCVVFCLCLCIRCIEMPLNS